VDADSYELLDNAQAYGYKGFDRARNYALNKFKAGWIEDTSDIPMSSTLFWAGLSHSLLNLL